MTEDKICPFSLSKDYDLCGVPCQRERCMAWVPQNVQQYQQQINGNAQVAAGTSTYRTGGYCKLIGEIKT
jgi:hypothetical protein